jgi:hypothetical protein
MCNKVAATDIMDRVVARTCAGPPGKNFSGKATPECCSSNPAFNSHWIYRYLCGKGLRDTFPVQLIVGSSFSLSISPPPLPPLSFSLTSLAPRSALSRIRTDDMTEHAANYESAMKRKSEDGERNTRAKRNRYISIAWWVICTRAIAVDADPRLLPVTSARGERSRYIARPKPTVF